MGAGAAGLALALALIMSCSKQEPAPSLDALQFPVVVLFGNSSILLCSGPAELTKMHTNYLTLNDRDPRLIDSKLNVYVMEKLRSVHGGLWLMAHPSEITEVTFELKRQKSGQKEAQRLFSEQLRKQSWRDDQAARLESLGQSQTLLEMEQIVRPNDG
jgi:hypothetical protein